MFSDVINIIKTKNNCFKALPVRIQRYTAVEFKDLSKMTLKFKMAYNLHF